jgi:hypothetical protein
MIECRGRNGWFNFHEACVSIYQDGTVAIRIMSKNPYRNMPPIYMAGPVQEIKCLLKGLLRDLQAQIREGR